jgi:hypothetical protein
MRFTVELQRTVVELAIVEVDAEDASEAQRRARQTMDKVLIDADYKVIKEPRRELGEVIELATEPQSEWDCLSVEGEDA